MIKVLFDGDSITDCFRTDKLVNPEFYAEGKNIGLGYPMLINSMLKVLSNKNYDVRNNGVSGDKTSDLLNRIKDSTNFKPDYYILMIGINDIWHHMDQNKIFSNEEFEKNYRSILQKMVNCNTNIKFIIQTITYNQGENSNKLFLEEVSIKNEIIKKVANDFNCMIIDSNKIIEEKSKETKLLDWLYRDGIHYTSNMNMLIADKILPYLV